MSKIPLVNYLFQFIPLSFCISLLAGFPGNVSSAPEEDKRLYDSACAACHGVDGTGRPQTQLAFEIAPPDFSDCEFASREPDPDWHAVIHEGGPIRAFDKMMPAFGSALTDEEIYDILRHVRTFCIDKSWPRGEFNLPRPLFTEKAFPEDETVFTTTIDAEGPGAMVTDILYEKRFGSRHQLEIEVPVGYHDLNNDNNWNLGIGDITLGYKHATYHNLETGRMLSFGAELILPTGDQSKGLGGDTVIIEPYAAFAQMFGDSFVQMQAFAEIPTESNANDEAGYRIAVGRTWTEGDFGRAWTPMIEALLTHEFENGSDTTNLDIVPQFQVALNVRQHILLNIGVKIPVTHSDTRDTQVVMYLLWDWFDGAFLDGW